MLTRVQPRWGAVAHLRRNAVLAGYVSGWIVCLVLTAITARVLYADGAYFLLGNLMEPHRFRDYDAQRTFASLVAQAPILLGQRLGVTSVAGYAALYALGVYAVPAAAYLFALYLSRSDPRLFALNAVAVVVFGFGVNFINTEVNLFFGLIFLCATLLALPGRHPALRAIVLPILAFMLLRVYEGMMVAGPVLAVMAFTALRKTEHDLGRAGLLLAGLQFLLGTAIGLQGFLAPRDPGNAANFVSSALAYLRGPQLHLLTSSIAALLAVFATLRPSRLVAGLIVVACGALFLNCLVRLDGYYAYSVYYYNRSFLVLAAPLILSLVAWCSWTQPSTDAAAQTRRLGWLLVPFAFAVAGDLVGTKRWNDYIVAFCRVVQTEGPVERRPDGLIGGGYLTGWSWTHPTMSVLLRDRESRVVVRNEAGQPWEPKDVLAVVSLPYQGVCGQTLLASRTTDSYNVPISFKGGRYPDYVASIRGLSTSEGWATWSDGPTIVVTFVQHLPSSFDAVIKFAAAYQENRGQPFIMRVGSAQQRFVVDAEPGEVTLRFREVPRASTLTIEVPKPQSPAAFGNASDTRKLGIALVSLSIVPTYAARDHGETRQ